MRSDNYAVGNLPKPRRKSGKSSTFIFSGITHSRKAGDYTDAARVRHGMIEQTGYFLKILCLSAPMLGVINMMTSYFQALGKAIKSLTITVLRNAALFIPGVILLNYFWGLNGVIAAQPVVEAVLTIVCIVMYLRDIKLMNA